MSKKITKFLIIISMVIFLLPTNVFAAENNKEPNNILNNIQDKINKDDTPIIDQNDFNPINEVLGENKNATPEDLNKKISKKGSQLIRSGQGIASLVILAAFIVFLTISVIGYIKAGLIGAGVCALCFWAVLNAPEILKGFSKWMNTP